MKRKIWLIIILLLAIVSIGYVLKTELLTSRKTVITILGEDSSNLNAYRSLAQDFNERTGIGLKFEGATFEQAMLKADDDFRNGSGKYDIVLQYNFSLSPYVRNSYVAKVEDIFSPNLLNTQRVTENVFNNALYETCFYYSNPQDIKSSPKQFGFPFAANTMLLVYNKNLFNDDRIRQKYKEATGKELAPPENWSDYILIAEFFSNVRPDLKGVCLQGAAGQWLYYELCNYLFSMGTGTSAKRYGWEEDRPLKIWSAENIQVLKYYKRLYLVSSGDFFTVDAAKQREIMLKGKTAMAIMWSDYVQPLAAGSKDSNSATFGFVPIPGKVSGLAGGAFYINRRSRHMEAASQFILFALEQENQTKLIECGLCSPLKTAYTDAVLARVPYASALRDSLDRGVFMFEAGGDAEIIGNTLTTYVQRFIRGEITESEALKGAQDEILAKRPKIK
jgi:ABC-type glycerol-3-phosphate transport system substrate-binding protein